MPDISSFLADSCGGAGLGGGNLVRWEGVDGEASGPRDSGYLLTGMEIFQYFNLSSPEMTALRMLIDQKGI